jgi:hypothetical protein
LSDQRHIVFPRWFCQQWRDLCRLSSTQTSGVEPKAPLEVRPLWNPKSSAPQGTLTMWLDILTLEEARKHPIKNITPPPAEDWEVRHAVCPLAFSGVYDSDFNCRPPGSRRCE